ncbi:MAG TPA: chemotaxis-specific protein-glutamate methyltransferase CheB [Nitrospiria bacterium]|nr:chemotaxis-specific protein-glutamate methyltransferase CheB [Nitrospiria bacterium]
MPRPEPETVRVLVVDDSAFYRQALVMMLKEIPGVEVVGTASDGLEAIQAVGKYRPTIITLDLEMPRMDGFGFLRWLMRTMPTPVLVISAASEAGNVFQALELGAADFLAKPTHLASWEILKTREDLHAKIRMMLAASPVRLSERAAKAASLRMTETVPVKPALGAAERLKLVAIGSSTGGPAALQSIVASLPRDLPCAVAVAQHMPAGFTASFAERLNRLSPWDVSEATPDQWCRTGQILICPGGHHLSFSRDRDLVKVVVERAGEEDRYVPSVDRMMTSAAEVFGADLVGVILTGMGHDGRRGMARIKQQGGFTIAESQETAVVFGMPQEAILEGAVDIVAPLYAIAEQIGRHVTASIRR